MMNNKSSKRKRLAVGLGILQIFVGIGAVPAGMAMISDPSGNSLGMSIQMLVHSPFPDFFIPGIFLLAINGIGSLFGGAATLLQQRFTGRIAVGLGIFLIIWIVLQVWWIGIHWLHVLYIFLGIVELILGLRYEKKQFESQGYN